MRSHRRCSVTALWILCATPLWAQTGGQPSPAQPLSLAEAVRLAQARSPLTQGAQARVQGADARVRSAGAISNPIWSLAQGFGTNTGGLDEDVLVTQNIELGDKRRQRVRAARAERDASISGRVGTALDLSYSVQSAYYEALRTDVERHLAADAVTRAQAFARAAQTQFQAGDVARSNVVRSAIELSRAEQALAVADTERANRYAALRSLAGLPDDTELTLTDTLTFGPTAYRLADLQSLALSNRPDLRSAQQLRDARQATLRQVRAQSQPDLFLEARRERLDPTTGGSSLRVGLIAPLFDLGRNRADAKAAQADLAEQEAALQETRRAALLDVENAYRTLDQSRRAVQSFQTGRLERDRELLDMTQIGYEHGANSYLELLDAQQVYQTEQTDYARALADFNVAQAALQRAVGGKLP